MKTKHNHGCRILAAIATPCLLAVGASAVPIEHDLNITVDTLNGTSAPGVTLPIGLNFSPGRSSAVLLKWGIPNSTNAIFDSTANFTKANLFVRNLPNDSDLSATIHQMLTDWDESTDFGTTFPVAGVDYVEQPIGAIGFNDDSVNQHNKQDETGLHVLVNAWVADTNLNKGLIIVPRPQANANYPTPPGLEAQLAARNRVPNGLDSDDVRLKVELSGTANTSVRLEAIDDIGINSGAPDSLTALRDAATMGVGVDDGGNTRMALIRFGLGEVVAANPTQAVVVTDADLELHISNHSNIDPVTATVHRVLVPWDEATCTWNQFGAGGPQPGADYEAVEIGTVVMGNGVKTDTIDITDAANDWMQDPANNHGIICMAAAGSTQTLDVVTAERVKGTEDGDDTLLLIQQTEIVPDFEPSVVVTNPSVVALSFESQIGVDYTLKTTDDLVGGTFTNPTPAVILNGDGGVLQLHDPAGGDPDKYYQIEGTK